jgi:ATP-dependent Zn protease
MTESKDELRRTAYHEAGHAFVAWRQGLKVTRATIRVRGEYLGSVSHSGRFTAKQVESIKLGDITPQIREKCEKRLRVLLAGWLAEHRYDRTAANEGFAGCDYGKALDYMLMMTGSQRETDLYFALLRYQTKTMLRIGWPQVKAIAEALLEGETLSGKEIVAVICKSLGLRQ